MFSKKTVITIFLFFFVAVSGIFLVAITGKRGYHSVGPGFTPSFFQDVTTGSIRFVKDIWRHHFFLIHASKENDRLRKELSQARERENRCAEIELANQRLNNLLEFKEKEETKLVAAEIIGKDPSPWHKSVIINKGNADGVGKGMPVLVPEGVTGLVMDASEHYAKVLLVIDKSSAVDALVQRTRARGIVKGDPSGECVFKYALRKDDIREGDTVVSSGLDGVFPKGIRIGEISVVDRGSSGIFQAVKIVPFADFEKMEELLVVTDIPKHTFVNGR